MADGSKHKGAKRREETQQIDRRRMWHFWPFLPLVPLLLLGCQLASRLLDGSNPAAQYGVERESAVFLPGSQPRTLDPALTTTGPDGPVGYLFRGLVTLDTGLQLQPDLAAGWRIDADRRTYTFYLRPDARFHDGRAITADDVAFSWDRAADPATGSDTAATYLGDIVGVKERLAGQADHIRGVRVIDEHTLRVEIENPSATFLAKLKMPAAFVVDQNNVAEEDWQHHLNGSGPFQLQLWRDDEMLVLERSQEYNGDQGDVQHLVYLIGAGIPLAMYDRGELDLVFIDNDTVERVRDPSHPLSGQLRSQISFCTSYLGFNVRQPPFDDPRVRQAFVMALDRDRLVDTVFSGQAFVAWGPLPPGMPGYSDLPGLPFDPERSLALLTEAGYEQLPPLTLTAPGYIDADPLVTASITRWQQTLDVTITPELVDPFTYSDTLYRGDLGHLFRYGWCADYPDPENMLDVLYHSDSPLNFGGYRDERLDAWLEQARIIEDGTRRMEQYGRIEASLIEQAPAVFLSHATQSALVSDRLSDYQLTSIGVPQLHTIHLASQLK